MDESPSLNELSDTERAQALARFQIVQPFLEGQTLLTAIAQEQAVTLRTLQRWVSRYRKQGLAGLVRKRRTDRGQHRLEPHVQQLIEGLALPKPRPTAAIDTDDAALWVGSFDAEDRAVQHEHVGLHVGLDDLLRERNPQLLQAAQQA